MGTKLARTKDVRHEVACAGSQRALGRAIVATLTELLGEPVHDEPIPLAAAPDVDPCVVVLCEPRLELEVTVTLLVDPGSRALLAQRLLGTADAESQDEVVRETANLVMGSVKAALLPAGIVLTAGLPTWAPRARPGAVAHAWAMRAGAAVTFVTLAVRVKRNVCVRGRDLREGMVAAETVRDAAGDLLVGTGTRLTATTAERLARAAPARRFLVCDPVTPRA